MTPIDNIIEHRDWTARFKAIPQADQTQENDQMAEILGLLPPDALCADESKMAALINNEENHHLPWTGRLGRKHYPPSQSQNHPILLPTEKSQ
jgi:hypothetical protein